jgi:hypothetical protein
MKDAFPRSKKWLESARIVGSATVAALRLSGFDILYARQIRPSV